jgi:hypothetical protein
MRAVICIGLIAAFGVAIGGIVWKRQHTEKTGQEIRAAALQSEIQTLQAQLAEKEARASHREPSITSIPTSTLAAPATNAAAPATKPNAAMLQDPETRALMRKQQEQALTRLADKLIDKNFVREWNLNPDQINQVKAMVREKAAAGKDMLNAMMFDGLDDDALAARGRETKERIGQADAQLQAVLGAGGVEALKDQERSFEAQQRVRRIGEELATVERPLTSPQKESLLETISSETRAYPFRVDLSDPMKVDFERIRDFFSEANMELYFEDMQQLNARIVDRATLYLTPEQVTQLKTTQQNQTEQARLTVKMTTELFNKPRGK